MTLDKVCKELWIKYLEDLSIHKPKEIKTLIIDRTHDD